MIRVPFAGLCAGLLSASLFAQAPAPTHVELKYAVFDPAGEPPRISAPLRGDGDTNLWIVQFGATPTDAMRDAVRNEGAELHGYLPENAYVVRMPIGAAAAIGQLADVRTVTYYHPAFRLEQRLHLELATGHVPERRYNLVVVDKHRDKPALAQRILAIGGRIEDEGGGSLLMSATLDETQLLQAARFDEVLWIDRWSAPEDDMDNARIQGGANYVEAVGGYTGLGIVGHQMEGLRVDHVDWNLPPIGFPSGCEASDSHGHNTAGIVYGNGTSSPAARGMAPDAQCVFTSCRTNRYNNFLSLISTHKIMFTTASWGSARTRDYTSVSAEADDICFDQDIIWTNSQSNAGNQDSRAEAWAKNTIAVGGVRHNNNSVPDDDSWQAGSASIGPAADGRTKPDLCAYYDNIATSSSASNTSYNSGFGGTSGATPIVAGHNALAIQMFTDGIFGNAPRVPAGSRFANKPKFPTMKALQIVCANQYPFSAASTDNRREHQGYGFPNLQNMWDDRGLIHIVDEEDVITQSGGYAYSILVPAGRSSLKICMSYADPAGNPAATLARINDLSLRVISPSGQRYWGNAGLTEGVWSTTGGSRDRINTAENVFVPLPQAGLWTVEVIGHVIAEDGHTETPGMDADYGLVVRGGAFLVKNPITVTVGTKDSFGQSCAGSVVVPPTCFEVNPSGGTLTRELRTYEYAYEAFATTALSVTGFDLWTAAPGGAVNAPVAIYLSTGSEPQATPLATSSVTIGPVEGFYTATFNPAVAIPANSTFYVALTHNNTVYISTLTSGTTSPGYYRNTSGWFRSGIATEPSFRVRCQSAGTFAAPMFELEGDAEIGQLLTASLTSALPGASASLFVGGSASSWSGLPLPFAFDLLGAPGCSLFVSGDTALPGVTDASGALQIEIDVPFDQNLVGTVAFLQFLVADPGANTLGLAVTNGYSISLGN